MSNSSVIDSRTGFAVPLRDPLKNPHNSNCALHLKRVCGVCSYFGGASVRMSGRCAKIGLTVAGNRAAQGCDWWERQTQAQAAAKVATTMRDKGEP